MLKQRVITAVLLAPLVLAIIWFVRNPAYYGLFVALLQGMSTYEWLRLNRAAQASAAGAALVSAGAVWWLAQNPQWLPTDGTVMMLFAGLWLPVLMWLKQRHWGRSNSRAALRIKGLYGALLIALFGVSLNAVHAIPRGNEWTLAMFLLIWVADIGAYTSGKNFGRHKLAPGISPGKTVEGALGALVLATGYAVLLAWYFALPLWPLVLGVPLIAAFSIVGDLAASLGKRHVNAKDSSQLLPGHGGFIDRFDSLIAAAPAFYLFQQGLLS